MANDTTSMVVILRVKPRIDPRRYEHWARTVEAPTVHATFGSVHRWELFRIEEAAPEGTEHPFDYIEVVTAASRDGLLTDIVSEPARRLTAEVQEFCHPPTVLLANRIV